MGNPVKVRLAGLQALLKMNLLMYSKQAFLKLSFSSYFLEISSSTVLTRESTSRPAALNSSFGGPDKP